MSASAAKELLRLGPRTSDVAHDRTIGVIVRGTAQGPLPSLSTLERVSSVRVPGPESDSSRASRLATANLLSDASAHDVARGLSDDWFGRRRKDVERTWQPDENHLLRGADAVGATELVVRTALNPLLWDEAARLVAADGAATAHALTDLKRASAIEESMRPQGTPAGAPAKLRPDGRDSSKEIESAFAKKIGVEVAVRHHADGSVEAVEVTVSSGHTLIDQSAANAVALALTRDASDVAPAAVALGRPFSSHWALRVNWEMNVPKCSLLAGGTGATSQLMRPDASGALPDGKAPRGTVLPIGCGTSFGNATIDVPFTVKRAVDVALLSVERH